MSPTNDAGMSMSKKTKSDETADVQRLKLDFPDIHADLIAGRIPSLRKALIAAGLKDERTRLDKLKNSWTKASPTERETFLKWLSSNGGPDGPAHTLISIRRSQRPLRLPAVATCSPKRSPKSARS